jgi:ribosomal protein S18 acetylase RimI-like enzyme
MNESHEPDSLFHTRANFEFLLHSIGRQRYPEGTREDETSVQCLTGLPHPFGNIVIVRKPDSRRFGELLGELESWAAEAKVPVSVLLFPWAEREARTAQATSRKWIQILSMPSMWMKMDEVTPWEPPADGVEVRAVKSPEDLDHVCRVLEEGYPVPANVADYFMRGIDDAGQWPDSPLVNFLVTVDGEPAACSTVCVQDGVAGIYCVATIERFRRRGLGNLVTRAALEYAQSLGAAHALLHATEQGESVYRRIGFVEDCRIYVLSYGM